MKTIVIVQCRLSSSRLPQKALYTIDKKNVLTWVLEAMKKVEADDYFVACDYDSADGLSETVKSCGYKLFAGDKDDVLNRFCKLIEKENPDIVLRATADNPFLFYDAASSLLKLYTKKYYYDTDYITYKGLPHGSGIEIFKASSLLKAQVLTDSPYDHEHVGPSLYNHRDIFNCLFLDSPQEYNYPELRTTIDTYADYIRACDVVDFLKKKNIDSPYRACDIVTALSTAEIAKKILYIPSVKKGQGTGHFRRCVELAQKTKGCVFLEDIKERIDLKSLTENFDGKRIITKLPLKDEYDLIVCDLFSMTKKEAETYASLGKTVFLDEGSKFYNYSDYLLDIIPSYKLKRRANLVDPLFISKPIKVKEEYPVNSAVKNVLIAFGGEDPADLSEMVLDSLKNFEINITAVSHKDLSKLNITETTKANIVVTQNITNLKDALYHYDLVITHYGLTAFECVMSRTPVLLCATSSLHKKLSDNYGFYCLKKKQINEKEFEKIFSDISILKVNREKEEHKNHHLSEFILNLAEASKYSCPLCGHKGIHDKILFRTEHHTFRKCSKCSMNYISFSDDSEKVKYTKSYFADEYKNQYGRTYLEDFDAIKKNCIRRIENIEKLYKKSSLKPSKNILDIGCAYGPFLSAASDASWTPFGTDIAEDAVKYVNEKLGFKAVKAFFADIDLQKEFGIDKLDAVTMWYVIEHVKDLNSTLKAINGLLKTGGIFAFSTPDAGGLSARTNKEGFYLSSPKDHYTLWKQKKTEKYLKRFGFKVIKTYATGIHPERHPFIKRHNLSEQSIIYKIIKFLITINKYGDTYEVYCRKTGGIKDGE